MGYATTGKGRRLTDEDRRNSQFAVDVLWTAAIMLPAQRSGVSE